MEGFEERLLNELNDLETKHKKLHDFLYTQTFYGLEQIEKVLLREQYKIMAQYINVLKDRIKYINNKKK